MSDVQHWGVDVRINGERVLTIESNSLSGIDNIMDYRGTVIECAQHLLAFIGEKPSSPFLPVDDWEDIETKESEGA